MRLLSIIIPFYNGERFIEGCLKSIFENTSSPFEVILSCDGDGEKEKDFIINLSKKFKFKYLFHGRVGFGENSNIGFRISKGDFIVFLNQDVILGKDWDISFFDLWRDGFGLIGSRLLYPDGKIQHFGIAFNPFFESRHLYRKAIYDGGKKIFNKPRELQAVTGALLFTKREIFQNFLFSSEYFMYHEDLDLCFRMRENGLKVILNPFVDAIHFESTSEDEKNIRNFHKYSGRKFLEKWKGRIQRDELIIYLKDRSFHFLAKRIVEYSRRYLKEIFGKKLSLWFIE